MVRYEKAVKELDRVQEIVCDMCGMRVVVDEYFKESIEEALDYYEFLHIQHTYGYEADYFSDGSKIELHICEGCTFRIFLDCIDEYKSVSTILEEKAMMLWEIERDMNNKKRLAEDPNAKIDTTSYEEREKRTREALDRMGIEAIEPSKIPKHTKSPIRPDYKKSMKIKELTIKPKNKRR